MKLLAIDTSTQVGSVAILDDEVVLAEVTARVRARHGEVLIAHVEKALALASLTIADIDGLAVGIGPGSFTGLRVGVSTAKGLALATDKPIVGVESTAALAAATASDAIQLVAIDAFKGEVFFAAYQRRATIVPPSHALPDEAFAGLVRAAPRLALGDGARKYETALRAALPDIELLPPAFDLPRATFVATLALEKLRAHGPDPLDALEPLYVRPSDAVLPASPLKLA